MVNDGNSEKNIYFNKNQRKKIKGHANNKENRFSIAR